MVRDEYADLLSVKEYTPESLEKWSKEAMEWILKQGGVKPAAEQFLKNHAPAEKHVATLARRMIINSDVYANAFSYEQRVKLNEQEIDDRSSSRVFTENYGQLRREMITAHAVGALNKIKVYLKSHLIIPGREFILFSMQKNHINISRGKYE